MKACFSPFDENQSSVVHVICCYVQQASVLILKEVADRKEMKKINKQSA